MIFRVRVEALNIHIISLSDNMSGAATNHHTGDNLVRTVLERQLHSVVRPRRRNPSLTGAVGGVMGDVKQGLQRGALGTESGQLRRQLSSTCLSAVVGGQRSCPIAVSPGKKGNEI